MNVILRRQLFAIVDNDDNIFSISDVWSFRDLYNIGKPCLKYKVIDIEEQIELKHLNEYMKNNMWKKVELSLFTYINGTANEFIKINTDEVGESDVIYLFSEKMKKPELYFMASWSEELPVLCKMRVD